MKPKVGAEFCGEAEKKTDLACYFRGATEKELLVDADLCTLVPVACGHNVDAVSSVLSSRCLHPPQPGKLASLRVMTPLTVCLPSPRAILRVWWEEPPSAFSLCSKLLAISVALST